MQIRPDRRYTDTHFWVILNGTEAICGVTDIFQSLLGEIVYVEIDEGAFAKMGQQIGYIEASKASMELFMPLSGEIVELNDEIFANPAIINNSPYDEGWLFKIRVENPTEYNDLLMPDQYELVAKNNM